MSLETRLIDWTVNHGRLNSRERYIGLSKIGDCPRRVYGMYWNHGVRSDPVELMKFYIGYASEDDVVLRLQGLGEYRPGVEISMFEGMVRGHTDGSFEGRLVEIKSVALDEHLPIEGAGFDTPGLDTSRKVSIRQESSGYSTGGTTRPAGGRLPHKVWWQVQAYLRYLSFQEAYVIYLARATGMLRVYPVREDRMMGQRIHNRVLALVRAVEGRQEPGCECGRCGTE